MVYPVGSPTVASSAWVVNNIKSFCCSERLLNCIVVVFDAVTAPTNVIAIGGVVDGVVVGVKLGLGVVVIVGVIELLTVIVGVILGDTNGAGVLDGVVLFVAVIDGVTLIVGVNDLVIEGDTLIVGVILGVLLIVAVGVGDTGIFPALLNAIVTHTHWSLFVERLYVPGSSAPANGSNK